MLTYLNLEFVFWNYHFAEEGAKKLVGTARSIVWLRTKHYFYWLLDVNEINTHVHLELKVLGHSAQAIISHLCWAIFTCNKNEKELIERFQSLKHHIANKHTFPQNTYYKKCDHPPLSTEQSQRKQWLEMGSAAHEKLVKITSEKTLLILSIWPNKSILHC